MANFSYYDILQQGLPEDLRVARLVHGVSWTAAVLSDGKVGVAMHTAGETVPRMFDSLIGLSLREAGKALLSWNMEEASEALAAVNAYYNSVGCPYTAPESKTLDGTTASTVAQHRRIATSLLLPSALGEKTQRILQYLVRPLQIGVLFLQFQYASFLLVCRQSLVPAADERLASFRFPRRSPVRQRPVRYPKLRRCLLYPDVV